MKNKMKDKEKVVISGMGIISSLGNGIKQFQKALELADTGITSWNDMESENDSLIEVGAKMPKYDFKSILNKMDLPDERIIKLAKEVTRQSDLVIQSSVLASLEAYKNAEMFEKPVTDVRKGIVVAGSNTNQRYSYELMEKYRDKKSFVTPNYALRFMDTNQVGVLSQLFSIKREGFTVGGASASGNVAIVKAMQMIQSGLLDWCMVVGVMADFSPYEFAAFKNLNAIGGKKFAKEPMKACRPFDKESEGFIYGQASACIILESEESAKNRGKHPLAELVAGVQCLDGNRLSNPSFDGECRVMEEVIRQAGIQKGEIDYINAHGTSTPLGDKTEADAIKYVFADTINNVYVNSTKGITGHCLYSAGVVEAIATVIQLQNGFLHGNCNLINTIEDQITFVGKEKISKDIKYGLSNSFGFGGIDTSILIGKL